MMIFLKQKTAYELRIIDWTSDVCSSDLYPVSLLIKSALTSWPYCQTSNSRKIWKTKVYRPPHSARPSLPDLSPTKWPNTVRSSKKRELRRGNNAADVRVGSIWPGITRDQDQIGRASCRERVCQDV